MPVLNLGDSNMTILPTSYSPSAVQRRFEIIEEVVISDKTYLVIFDAETPKAAVIEAELTMLDNDTRHRVVAWLELGRPEKMDGILSVKEFWQDTDAVQVEGVLVSGEMRDIGLASLMYEALVLNKNITLMSDNVHYAGGKALWQRIARRSDKLIVFVLDSDEGKFYPYDGTKIRYDGGCIPEGEIWSIHPDKSRHGVILVAEDATKYPQVVAA